MFFSNFTSLVVLVMLFMLCVPHRTNKLFFILLGYFALIIGALLTGPSKILGFSSNLKIMTAGMCIAGVGKGLIQSFYSTYIIENALRRFPDASE